MPGPWQRKSGGGGGEGGGAPVVAVAARAAQTRAVSHVFARGCERGVSD